MSDKEHVQKTLDLVLSQVQELEKQTVGKKRIANDLCRMLEREPVFKDLTSSSGFAVRPDEYYGKPITDVIRSVLLKRNNANLGAVSVGELYDAMIEGGYHFQTQNEAHAKRGIYSVLAANSDTFHRLPNGRTGLKEWYPAAKTGIEHNGRTQKRQKRRTAKVEKTPRKKVAVSGTTKASKGKSRLEQIQELMKETGPMSHREIKEKSGLPVGTIGSVVNKKNFKKNADGRWSLKTES